MARAHGRIRLPHLEVVYPDGGSDCIAWPDVIRHPDVDAVRFTKPARELHPRLPRSLTIAQGLWNSAIPCLQQRVFRQELESGTHDRLWTCKPVTTMGNAVFIMLAGMLLQGFVLPQSRGTIDRALHSLDGATHIPPPFLVVAAIMLLLSVMVFVAPIVGVAAWFLRRSRLRGTQDELLAFHTASTGLSVQAADGSERFFPWRSLQRLDRDRGFVFDRGGEVPIHTSYAPRADVPWREFKSAVCALYLSREAANAPSLHLARRLRLTVVLAGCLGIPLILIAEFASGLRPSLSEIVGGLFLSSILGGLLCLAFMPPGKSAEWLTGMFRRLSRPCARRRRARALANRLHTSNPPQLA